MLFVLLVAFLLLSCSSPPAAGASAGMTATHRRHHAHSALRSHSAVGDRGTSLPAMVGILTSPCNDLCSRAARPAATSFLAASYVKLVEAAGARVVPVRVDRPWAEIDAVLDTVDMLLLPGGSARIADGSPYYEVIKQLVTKVRTGGRSNALPITGFCLGMEAFLSAMANNASLVSPVEGMTDVSLPFHLTDPALASTTAWFGSGAGKHSPAYPSDEWAQLMTRDPITYHSHTHAVMLSSFNQAFGAGAGAQEVEALAVNYVNERPLFGAPSQPGFALSSADTRAPAERAWNEDDDLAFVTIARMTSGRGLFFMFHPEKVSHEWSPRYQHLHTADWQYEAMRANAELMQTAVYSAAETGRSANIDRASYDYIDAYLAVDTRAFSDYQQVYFFD